MLNTEPKLFLALFTLIIDSKEHKNTAKPIENYGSSGFAEDISRSF